MKKKILVAVDGSYCSLNEIQYLSMLFGGHEDLNIDLICFVSAGSLPLGSEWMDDADRMNILSPQARQRFLVAKKHMKEEVNYLTHNGFREDQISGSVKLSRVNVASDLIAETYKGSYDALFVGRRGIGKLHELVMGSVTTTILDKCFNVPIWVIDGQVDSRKILVPVDGSWHCLHAVDHLGFILSGVKNVEITLFHSLSWFVSKKLRDPDKFDEMLGKEWCETHLKRPDYIFHGPEQILRESGFDMSRVNRAEEGRGLEPARDILLQAKHKKFGTIVMGRRGPDEPKGILGGVSDRVLRTVNNVAVWLFN